MSVLTYNGVTFPYAFVTEFIMTPVYDDSHTDWYLTRYDITVQTLINFNYLGLMSSDLINPDGTPQTTNPAAITDMIRDLLMRPRRELTYTFNGVNLLPEKQFGNAGTVDAQNGPQPQRCVFTELTNNNFLMTYQITANYWEIISPDVVPAPGSPGRNNIGNDVLYNRWSETFQYDHRQYMTRTRNGKYVIRSDNRHGIVADFIRDDLAVLGVPDGFVRDSSSYKVDPSGLAIEYTVVDREVWELPPPPAYRAEGHYTETMSNCMSIRRAECRVRLEGSRLSPQQDLINRAVAVCAGRIAIRDNETRGRNGLGHFEILEGAQVSYGIYENWVEVTLKAFGVVGETGGSRLQGVAGFSDMDTKPFGPKPPTPTYFAWGTCGLVLRSAAYWDPSLLNLKLDQNRNQNVPGLVPGQAGKNEEA